MTTLVPPQLIRPTGTLTVEDIALAAQTGNEGTIAFSTDLAAAGDIQNILFSGEDSLGNPTQYAGMIAEIVDPTNASEDGALRFETIQAGSNAEVMTLALGMTMNGATGGDQGNGTINATNLYVNGVAVTTGGGDVFLSGTPADNQVAIWTNGTTIEGDTGLTFDGTTLTAANLTVTGDLTVSGDVTQQDVATLTVEDPLIELARANTTTDVIDIGFFGNYDTSGSQDLVAGLFRDATDGKFRLFVDSQEDLSAATVVNTGATGYAVATLVANLEGNVTGQVSDVSNHDSDDISEGATNLYASTANVNTAGAVMETDYNANTVLAANADDTPLPLTMGASTILARLAAGNIVAATPTELRTLLNVENGAEENLDWNSATRVTVTDYTEGVSTTLTLPIAAPGDDEDHVRVSYNGVKQHASEWTISGTTLTVATIPVGVTEIELQVLA